MKLNRNSKIFINYFLAPALFIWLSWSIYRQIQKQPGLSSAWQAIKESFGTPLVWNLIAVILLMVVNWAIEAVKWKISVRQVQDVGFIKAFRAVLSGVSFSVSMPNRVGEYFGRVLYMDEGNKLKTISLSVVGSISQLIITLLMGGIGLIMLRSGIEESRFITPIWMNVILYGVAGALLITGILYFRLSWIIRWIDSIPAIARYTYLIKALEEFTPGLLLRLLALSFLRFVVFILQYYLLFQLFSVPVSWWECYWAISISFLVMAVIPSIALLELVQRGKIMTMLLSLYTTNQLGVGFTAAGIWLINLIIPAVIGSLLIFGIKRMFRLENETLMKNK